MELMNINKNPSFLSH